MATKIFPRIKEVRAYVVDNPAAPTASAEKFEGGADCHDVEDAHWINGNLGPDRLPIANPMSVWEQYKVPPTSKLTLAFSSFDKLALPQARRTSWGINALGSFVVEIESEDGTTGVGISIGGEPGCYIVERHLSRFVEGEDPRDVEAIWVRKKMKRLDNCSLGVCI